MSTPQELQAHGERVLVVEDDDALREDLVLALESEGYEVSACSAGLEAIELAHRQPFDLVVSDIRMAGMSGLDALERMQQSHPMVATLVITGYTAEADSIRAVRMGVGDYLKKPFRLDEFLQAVARQLVIYRGRRKRWAREQSLQKTAHWSLEAWLAGAGEVIRAGQVAEAIAAEMGLSPEVGAQARRAVLLAGGLDKVELNTDGLPADMLAVLQEMRSEDATNETLSLTARIAHTALSGSSQDSSLSQALERVQTRPASSHGSGGEHRLRRNVLRLGRAQEQSGFPQEAHNCYSQLLAAEAQDLERVEALLGMVRLSQGQPEKCRVYAQEAVQLARQLKPLAWGLASLEAGLAMAKVGYQREAIGLLENARRLAGEMGQRIMGAKATLALADVSLKGEAVVTPPSVPLKGEAVSLKGEDGEALSCLLDTEARNDLLEASPWLAPALLRLQVNRPSALQEKALSRLGRDTPQALLAQSGSLSAPARVALVQALAGSSHPVAVEGLKGLLNDSEPTVRQAAERALKVSGGEPVAPTLRIYTLGGFEVWRGDERIPDNQFRSWKQRFLLARLAGSPRPIASERLMDEFWPDDAEGGRASLNVGFSHLRRLLRPTDWPRELDYVVRDKGRLGLNPDLPTWHDLNELYRCCEDASLERWQQAVRLYRGAFLENCYLDWAVQQREKAELAVQGVLRKLLEALLEQGRASETLEYGSRLLELDSCCQEGHLAIMKAHLQLKRPEAAVRQFEVCKRVLKNELAMEPSMDLLEYHQRALLSLP